MRGTRSFDAHRPRARLHLGGGAIMRELMEAVPAAVSGATVRRGQEGRGGVLQALRCGSWTIVDGPHARIGLVQCQ